MKTLKEILKQKEVKINKLIPNLIGDEIRGSYNVTIKKKLYYVIASNTHGFDHLSISIPNTERNPKWLEMCAIKDLFFNKDETVIQYHPSEENYVNTHEYCLHLWRPQNEKIPLPPKWMI